MAGYDPRKAAAYNKLRQQGLSDEAAFQQSGITDAETDNYVVNDVPGEPGRGTIGPVIAGPIVPRPASPGTSLTT